MKPQIAAVSLIIFFIVPLILAMTTNWWYWKIRLIREVRPRKKQLDAQLVNLPIGVSSLGALRQYEQLGAKVTIAHHLATVAGDVEHKIRTNLLRTTIFTTVLAILLAVALTSKTTSDGAPGRPFSEVASQLGQAMLLVYLVPVGMAAFVLDATSVVMALLDQIRKYEDVLMIEVTQVVAVGSSAGLTAPDTRSSDARENSVQVNVGVEPSSGGAHVGEAG